MEPVKKGYADPLNCWYIKPMAYSNEFGTAISQVAPKLGAALWVPSLMYMGADIYDKYKNDKDTFSPSGRRAFQEAIYQGVTGLVAAPLIILAGQKIVSPIGKLSKSGVSSNARDCVYRHTMDIIDQSAGEVFEDSGKFNDLVNRTLKNKIDARKKEYRTNNPLKKISKYFRKDYALISSDEGRLLEYAEHNVKKLFEIKESITQPKKIISTKAYRTYHRLLPQMKELHGGHDVYNHAMKGAFKEYQTGLIFKNKLLKTTGGLAALLLLIGPVNRLIEKHFIKKVVDPGLQKISSDFANNFYLKKEILKKPDNQEAGVEQTA